MTEQQRKFLLELDIGLSEIQNRIAIGPLSAYATAVLEGQVATARKCIRLVGQEQRDTTTNHTHELQSKAENSDDRDKGNP